MRDVSATGMGLLGARSFDVGRLLRIEISLAQPGPALPLPMCVVRVVRQEDGTWLIGGSFTERLGDADLQRLLEQLGRQAQRTSG